MKMLHATPIKNLRNIKRRGIKASRSKGAVATVWLVSPGMLAAALAHAQKRHRVAPEAVAVLEVDIPRSWLRKGRRKGLHHTGGRDIPAARITAVTALVKASR